MQLVNRFSIHDAQSDWTISHIKCLPHTSLLLTVSFRTGHPLCVQLWNLDRLELGKRSGGLDSNQAKEKEKETVPHLHATVNVQNGANTFPLTAFAVSSDNNVLAFGFADGAVIIVRGDIVHDRGSRQRLVYKSSIPITGVAFDGASSSLVYVTTLNQVLTVSTSGRNNGKPDTVLDKANGANLGCVAVDESNIVIGDHDASQHGNLVVARTQDISWYSLSRRGPSFALDVPKRAVYAYEHYLFIVVDSRAEATASESPRASPFASSPPPQSQSQQQQQHQRPSAIQMLVRSDAVRVLIVDTIAKFIVYSGQISRGVSHVFSQWGCLNVIGSDGILYRFHEKPLATRIDILEASRLYDAALDLAKLYSNTMPSSESAVADSDAASTIKQIHLHYADYLYDEDKKEEALRHYSLCVDAYNTSHVIVKYRDSQYIAYLTQYLETIATSRFATTNHISLLLNCYAKVKQLDKLQHLLESTALASTTTTSDDEKINPELVDYDVAIDLCRKVGCHELAAKLADKNGDCDLAVQLHLTEFNDAKGALDYIETLTVTDALRILINYSREFLECFPVRTTVVLIALFTGKYVPKQPDTKDAMTVQYSGDLEADYVSYAAPVLQSYRAFVNYVASKTLSNEQQTLPVGDSPAQNGADSEPEDDEFTPTYQPPRPRLIFASFLNHPFQFVIFLEACLESSQSFEADARDQSDIVSALLESYLNLAKTAARAEDRSSWEAKAAELLRAHRSVVKSNNTISLIKYLTIDESAPFTSSTEVLEVNGGHDTPASETTTSTTSADATDALRSCIAANDIDGVRRILLRKYTNGTTDYYGSPSRSSATSNNRKEFHALALSYLVSSKDVLSKCEDILDKIFEEIKQERTLAPLQVFEILSTKSVATVGHVRKYLVELITAQEDEIQRNEQLAESYKTESDAKKEQIKELLTSTKLAQNAQCEYCSQPLDLPCIHFACGHSYHQRCLDTSIHATSQSSPSCPKCLSEYDNIKMLRKAQDEMADRADLFDAALEESDAKFRVLTDFVGHGALTSMVL